MKIHKRIIRIMLILILSYCIISTLLSNRVFGAFRTLDLSGLNNYQYRGILPFIQELQIAYPNWTFTLLYTGFDWNSVIEAETTGYHGKSLTQNTSSEWLCPICQLQQYDSNSGWYCASNKAVSFYMDPRNWINGKNIFSFEQLSYNRNTQTIDGVKAILKGTFMDTESITYTDTSGNLQTINKSYAQIIMEAAEESGVSPYHLASRLKQEQGTVGNSQLISGTFTYGNYNFTGYYNYFNIGASGNGDINIIINGLSYASSDKRAYKWTSPELAIKGGANFIASGYIGKGQDTLYLQKYDVNRDTMEKVAANQYMQNISAHISEGISVYNAYNSIGILNTNFNFIIPVYENMPVDISPRPTTSSNLTTENVLTTASILNMRASNSTWSSKIAEIPFGTTLLRIETAKNVVNGYYWDKVIYFKDNQALMGYVARDYITQIGDITTTEEKYYTNTCAILKNGPGINCEPKKILDYSTELTVIDKMTYTVDNIIWYRVKLGDGTQGYIASNFLNTISTEIPTEEVYKIQDEIIIAIPGIQITQIEGATTTSEVFGTGAKVNIGETEYTLVILGDTTGDGLITPLDYVKIKNHIMNMGKLVDSFEKAGDTTGDGLITPLDYVKVKNHIMNMGRLSII